MAVPDYQSLMLPVLVASSKGEIRIGDAVNQLADELALTPEERGELLPSGKQTLFSNRVHWAKTYLTKANVIEITRRGYFKITDRGQEVLQSQPARIDNNFLAQFSEFREFRERSVGGGEQATQLATAVSDDHRQTPDEIMRGAHRQIEASLAQELLDKNLKGTARIL